MAIEKDRRRVAATGFFDNEDDFVRACRAYNARCDVYAGRNPRPYSILGVRNYMNINWKKRAKDLEIKDLTAISLDIDPIRAKGLAASERQKEKAVGFALRLQNEFGGMVDDSGNGSYLWLLFSKTHKGTRR